MPRPARAVQLHQRAVQPVGELACWPQLPCCYPAAPSLLQGRLTTTSNFTAAHRCTVEVQHGTAALAACSSGRASGRADGCAALSQDNPHTLRGALVQGSTTGFDSWADTRTRNESRVALEYNAGYTSALAAFEELTSPTWPQCLQGFGYFSKVPLATCAPLGAIWHACPSSVLSVTHNCPATKALSCCTCADTLCVPSVQDVVCG